MKHLLKLLPVALLTISSTTVALAASEAIEVDYREILVKVDDYKNERVTYVAPLTHISRNIPEFLEREGYDDDDDVIIGAGNAQVPVCAKGSDEIEEFLLNAPRGSLLRVTGKIRETDADPRGGFTSGYYLDLEDIELVERKEVQEQTQGQGYRGGPGAPRFRRLGPPASED